MHANEVTQAGDWSPGRLEGGTSSPTPFSQEERLEAEFSKNTCTAGFRELPGWWTPLEAADGTSIHPYIGWEAGLSHTHTSL